MILLDTNAIIWLAGDNPKLGDAARAMIAADEDRRASVMVWWEVAMLARKGRLSLQMPLEAWLAMAIYNIGIRAVQVTSEIAQTAGDMDDGIHGDPCDRIMIATAQALDCPLVTSDKKILAYSGAGHLKAIDARV